MLKVLAAAGFNHDTLLRDDAGLALNPGSL
jgi:hypothetical protein